MPPPTVVVAVACNGYHRANQSHRDVACNVSTETAHLDKFGLMSHLFRNKYRIPTARAPWWDYSRDGAYFVTICTKGRLHFFGEVVNGEMCLSEIGQIATEMWKGIPDHFPFVHLDEFVVMPSHMHGIIIIDRRDTVETLHATATTQVPHPPVETLHATSLPQIPTPTVEPLHATAPPQVSPPTVDTLHATSLPQKNEAMAAISPRSGSLATIIRSYKSAVSREARPIHADFAWQTRYHEHIIRKAEVFERIRYYIINNPLVWDKDKFNPNNTK